MFQDYALFPHLTVGRNVAFGIHDLPRGKQANACAGPEPGGPGGQRRRPFRTSYRAGSSLARNLARSMAPRPRLMLLDEPFSNLDTTWTCASAWRTGARHPQRPRTPRRCSSRTTSWRPSPSATASACWKRPPAPVGRRLRALPPPGHAFVADFIGHGVFAPLRWCSRATSGGPHDWATSRTSTAACCPRATRAASAMCCYAPTTWCTTTPRPCACASCARSLSRLRFLYTLELEGGLTVMAHVPSHHDHAMGDWIGIRPQGGPCGDLPRG